MFHSKYNKENITEQELNQIEKRFEEYLKQGNNFVGGPEFNVLDLCRTDIFALVLNIFIRLNIHHVLKINISQVLDFLIDVAEKYTETPYHTFYHAADIVTMLYYLVHDLNHYLTDLDVTFLMVAALCHDIGHPGLNNAFQNNTKTDLAIKYGGKSILETYSVDLTIELFKKHNIKHPKLNEMVQDLILSTDMEFHSELELQAKKLIDKKISSSSEEEQDRMSLCRVLLHAADISSMARPWNISKQWSDLIIKEFFSQGDQERKLNMTISPGMDRRVCSQKNISLKFGEIILPFFEALVSSLPPKSHVLLDFFASNRIQWEKCLDSSPATAAITINSTNVSRKRKYQQPEIRRINSDITLSQQHPIASATRYKRIRLEFRSASFPTISYQQSRCSSSITDSLVVARAAAKREKSTQHLFPLINFKTSSLCDTSNNIESIVLYHPYDQ